MDEGGPHLCLAGTRACVAGLIVRLPSEWGVVPPYPAATDWTYEAGIKAKLLNDRLELSAAAFHNGIKNGVMSYPDPALGAFVTTYQDYQTSGFELQGRLLVADGLTFTGGVGYTYSELGANGAKRERLGAGEAPGREHGPQIDRRKLPVFQHPRDHAALQLGGKTPIEIRRARRRGCLPPRSGACA